MFEKWIVPFRQAVEADEIMRHLQEVTAHHRIQASPGYRSAARYCLEQLRAAGLEAEIVEHPANPDAYFGNCRSFLEWECREGELRVVEPVQKLLSRYTELEMSIIQRSIATPPEGLEAELVVVEHGDRPESYEGIDVRGRIVLTQGAQMRVHELAVVRHGALGIVLDNMAEFPPVRTRQDLYDAVQYTSFWWYDHSVKGFGFALSPRAGDELRELCKQGPVKVWARVDAELKPGLLENVEAFIPGTTDEEVLLVSHLCHPKPGANDNASGPSTLLETARVLQRLIAEGRIDQPKRGIRFLMIPEMTGTHAYVNARPERLAKTVAALNLDMVGGDQKRGAGPLTIEKPTRALPSFVAELAHALFEEGLETDGVQYQLAPFSGGSDHYIVADPSVGIPCPMMITWPHRFYHTSADTVENIDPQLMAQVAVTAGAYLHWVANAGLDDLLLLAGRMAEQFGSEAELVPGGDIERLQFVKAWKTADLHSLAKLVPAAQMSAWQERIAGPLARVETEYARRAEDLRGTAGTPPTRAADAAGDETNLLLQKVFVRKHRGPVELQGFVTLLEKEERERWLQALESAPNSYTLLALITYWMDGKRTVGEIIRCVELESGMRAVAATVAYVQILQRLGLLVELFPKQ